MRSMTGFGRGKYENDSREYIVEMKSVNHKYNEITIKMPRNITYLEENVKKEISKVISRGKVDVYISFVNSSNVGRDIKINTELAGMYINELRKICNETGIQDNINVIDIAKMPDVLNIQNDEDEELIWSELQVALNDALNGFASMRQVEGDKIKNDLLKRINEVLENTNKISNFSTRLVEDYVVKLTNKVKEYLKTNVVDESRLAQEVVIYADKCSVEEEITRLKSHINQFVELLNTDGAIGKKIDFLLQEMNRETNTIGSKANCLDITNLVVEIKTELENIREQIQNIE